jgi:hypothetical protein
VEDVEDDKGGDEKEEGDCGNGKFTRREYGAEQADERHAAQGGGGEGERMMQNSDKSSDTIFLFT